MTVITPNSIIGISSITVLSDGFNVYNESGYQKLKVTDSGELQLVTGGTVSAPVISKYGDTNTGIFFPANDTLAFATGGSERLRINASGNIGIGTDNPSTKLQINGVLGFETFLGNYGTITNIRIGDNTTGANLTPTVDGYGAHNIFMGVGAGNSTTTGNYNNFFGVYAGRSNTTGTNNNFFGPLAGYYNTTGCRNNFLGSGAGNKNTTGSDNNFLGVAAGFCNTTGSCNNFFGQCAGYCNTTGCFNNFLGFDAGRLNTIGSFNNFLGYAAGFANTTGCHNNFFGLYAGCSNTTGSFNTFFGFQSGYCNTTGGNNNFFGCNAGFYNTTGSNNNFIGNEAGALNTTGSYNNFFGRNVGCSNTTGSYNNFFGRDAGFCNTTGCYNNFFGLNAGFCNTAGCDNNFFGRNAGYCNTTGSFNTFFGSEAGFCNTTGGNNNFFGCNAGFYNTTGCYNNFFGYAAGRCNTTGTDNNFFGNSAGYFNTTGSCNNFFGFGAGLCNTTGSCNNFFGFGAGRCNTTGTFNTFLGTYTGISTSASNKIILGRGGASNQLFDAPDTTKDNQFAVGIRTDANSANYWLVGNENFNIGIGTTNPAEKLTVQGNALISGITTGNFFDGFVPGGDKVYTENATINNGKINVALESDIVVESGKTLTVSTGSTIILNPFDFETSSVEELLIDKLLTIGFTSSFVTVASGVGSVGVTSTRLVGSGINTTNNIAIGQLVKPIPGIISTGTTVTSISGIGTTIGVITINPPSINTTIQEDITFKFGSYGEKESSIILDGEQSRVTTRHLEITDEGDISSSSGKLFLNSDVGIGISSPSTKLQIDGVLGFKDTNIRIGDNSTGSKITTGTYNNFLGSGAGYANTTGNRNVFIGYVAGYCNSTGTYNIFFGSNAGQNNTTGSCNIYIGGAAGGGPNFKTGNNNFFGGYTAGYNNSTGNNNNFLGYAAGYCNTTGSCNNFLGLCAGRCNTTGTNNNFFGYLAGFANTTGTGNNFFGQFAGCSNTTGGCNNFYGTLAGRCNTTGSCNSFFGRRSGYCNTTGSNNTFLGHYAGGNNSTGSNNVVIGPTRNAPILNGSNQLAIGAGSTDWIVGNNLYNVGIGTTNPTNMFHVSGGASRFAGVVETVSVATTYVSGAAVVLEMDVRQATTYTYTMPASTNIGIVSFKNMPAPTGNATGSTVTLIVTQNAAGTGNTTAATGIGTNCTVVGFENGASVAGISTRALVGSAVTTTLSTTGSDVDFVSFYINYSGGSNTADASYKIYVTKNGGFRRGSVGV